MTNYEARRELFGILRKDVPNRDVCRTATKKQIQQIMDEVNLKFAKKKLDQIPLGLSRGNIPEDLLFELILFILSTTEWEGDKILVQYMDSQFWNFENKETAVLVKKLKKFFKIEPYKELTTLKLEDFLVYAKSEQPDF